MQSGASRAKLWVEPRENPQCSLLENQKDMKPWLWTQSRGDPVDVRQLCCTPLSSRFTPGMLTAPGSKTKCQNLAWSGIVRVEFPKLQAHYYLLNIFP